MKYLKPAIGYMALALLLGLIAISSPRSASAQSNKNNATVKTEKDDDDDERPSADDLKQVKITMDEARAIALKRVSGTIIEEGLEKEAGRLQYSFDIRTAEGKVFDVELSAITGELFQAIEDKGEDTDDKAKSKTTKAPVNRSSAAKKN